jgi:hypothetical protein
MQLIASVLLTPHTPCFLYLSVIIFACILKLRLLDRIIVVLEELMSQLESGHDESPGVYL